MPRFWDLLTTCKVSAIGHRPSLSGPVQVLPGPGRRAPADGDAVRRTQCLAGEPGRAGRGLALGDAPDPFLFVPFFRQDWRWGTLFQRSQRDVPPWLILPSDPPLPRQWRAHVNQPQTEAELAALRNCIRRGCPFGTDAWCRSSAVRLGLESSLRPRGRPRKEP